MDVLAINGLSKHYGTFKALDQLDLTIPKGAIFGLLGPNGSGKSTTLGMCLGVIQPTSGTFSWFNQASDKVSVRKNIGAILEKPNFYPYLNAIDNLKIVAAIKDLQQVDERIKKVLNLVDLWGRRNTKFKAYSLGMKQRLSLAAALLANPDVLVLDEPTNGLDPQGIADMRSLITQIGKSGKTIILASHLLDEVQKVCNYFAVLNKGRLVYNGLVSELDAGESLVLLNAENKEQLIRYCQDNNWLFKNEYTGIELKLPEHLSVFQLNHLLINQGIRINELALKKHSLEDKFLNILKEDNA